MRKQPALPIVLDSEIETPVMRAVLVAVTALPGVMAWRNQTGAGRTVDGRWISFGLKGSADIIGACRGRAIAIESKRPRGGRWEEQQQRFAKAWCAAGGVYILARSVDEALAALASIP